MPLSHLVTKMLPARAGEDGGEKWDDPQSAGGGEEPAQAPRTEKCLLSESLSSARSSAACKSTSSSSVGGSPAVLRPRVGKNLKSYADVSNSCSWRLELAFSCEDGIARHREGEGPVHLHSTAVVVIRLDRGCRDGFPTKIAALRVCASYSIHVHQLLARWRQHSHLRVGALPRERTIGRYMGADRTLKRWPVFIKRTGSGLRKVVCPWLIKRRFSYQGHLSTQREGQISMH